MARPRPWIVMPHGPLRTADLGLWTVESVVPTIPGRTFPRTMTIVRLEDGSLLLHNAVPVDDRTMRAIAALGRIAVLLLPSAFHCVDAHAMARRTGARVVAPAAAREAVEAVVPVSGDFSTLPQDPHVRMEPLEGVSNGEGVLVVERGGQLSYLFCDAIVNVRRVPGAWGLLWALLGFTGEPGPTRLWRRSVLRDPAAFAAHLRHLARRPGLRRLIPSHGPPIEESAAAVLRDVAARIAGPAVAPPERRGAGRGAA